MGSFVTVFSKRGAFCHNVFKKGLPFVTIFFKKEVPFVTMFSKGGVFWYNIFGGGGGGGGGGNTYRSEEKELKINRLTWDLKHNLGECKTSQNLIILNTRIWNSS